MFVFVKIKSWKQNDYSKNGSGFVGYADLKSCKNYIKYYYFSNFCKLITIFPNLK